MQDTNGDTTTHCEASQRPALLQRVARGLCNELRRKGSRVRANRLMKTMRLWRNGKRSPLKKGQSYSSMAIAGSSPAGRTNYEHS